MTKMEELRAKRATLEAELQETAKAYFSEEAKSLFERFPKLESFGWTQYTPYFNDGEECVFGVNRDYLTVNGDGDAEGKVDKEHSWKTPPQPNPYYNEDIAAIYPEVSKFINAFEEKDLKDMFGDHCKITAKRDGVTVEAYEHD